jgi:trimethylamine-N-oxide reductase (cytochrome c), cytochrome c-type subunit TorC
VPAAAMVTPAGDALGSVAVATAVSVADDGTAGHEVVLQGWAMEAAPGILYYTSAQRIALSQLTEAGVAAREVLEAAPDAFGTMWHLVRIRGVVPASDLRPDLVPVWDAGEALLTSNCASCHNAPTPDQFTVNQWPGTLQSMVPSMVALSPEDLDLLTKFLQYHASDMR